MVALVDTTATFFSDTNVTNGVGYYYVVTATSDVGESDMSNEVMAVAATIPGAPLNLQGTQGDNKAILSWNSPDSGGSPIIEYRIYRSNTSGANFDLLSTTTALSFSDSSAINGNTYYYVVTAVNFMGESADSAEVVVILTGNPPEEITENQAPSPILEVLMVLIAIPIFRKFRREKLRRTD